MAEPLHRIRRARPGDAPAALVIEWDDGAVTLVDLTGVIARVKAFAPLAEPAVFRRARVIDGGLALGWPGGLDYAAASLRLVADEQRPMTGADFIDWQRALTLSNQEAADLLDISLGTVKNLRRRAAAIPRPLSIACRQTLRDPTVFRAHFRPRRPGRPRRPATG